jgi:hypothetical protein
LSAIRPDDQNLAEQIRQLRRESARPN